MLDEARDQRVCRVLGARLRDRRHQLGLTQSEVAGQAGISVKYLSQIEHGERNPTVAVVVRLARALDVTPAELMAELDRVV